LYHDMKPALRKRSIKIRGRNTSVSLEDDFWNGFQEIAKRKKIAVSTLVEMINKDHNQSNLSSAIRVYVFRDFCMRLNGQNLDIDV
jgi:predicted DNA-binding ribbon-helix-helix protein